MKVISVFAVLAAAVLATLYTPIETITVFFLTVGFCAFAPFTL